MKKNMVLTSALVIGILLTACGRTDIALGADTAPGAAENGSVSSAGSGNVASESDAPENSAAASGTSAAGELSMDELKAAGALDTEMESAEEVLLSDHILKTGDTMQIMYLDNSSALYTGLEITLHGAEMFDSPEAAGLNRTQMQEETENYDTSENPEWCKTDDANILVCDLNVSNISGDPNGELHIGEIMIAYADPDTGRVSIVSCAPAYFSASSSHVGASDYYHYQVPREESRNMTVAWAVQKEYEAENLYLCVTYDVREPQERQYFRVPGAI